MKEIGRYFGPALECLDLIVSNRGPLSGANSSDAGTYGKN
jgi:hypothetical protein